MDISDPIQLPTQAYLEFVSYACNTKCTYTMIIDRFYIFYFSLAQPSSLEEKHRKLSLLFPPFFSPRSFAFFNLLFLCSDIENSHFFLNLKDIFDASPFKIQHLNIKAARAHKVF